MPPSVSAEGPPLKLVGCFASLTWAVNVAFGVEARFENYVIAAGEPDSWRDGGSLNQFGTGRAVPGA